MDGLQRTRRAEDKVGDLRHIGDLRLVAAYCSTSVSTAFGFSYGEHARGDHKMKAHSPECISEYEHHTLPDCSAVQVAGAHLPAHR